jgi:hypothetical protein
MAYFPPKGVRPPQFEGKRTGRPKGSRNWSRAWKELMWGYEHAKDFDAEPPSAGAGMWQAFASVYYYEVREWLKHQGAI